MLAEALPVVTRISPLYRTPAFPPGAGPDFVNAALSIDTPMHPQQVLDAFHEIETRFARVREERWGGRTLDIDLLAAGDTIAPDLGTWRYWHDLDPARQRRDAPDQLILPHPRMQDRGFVLIPLRDIAPGWRHPVLRRTVAEMCSEILAAEVNSVVKLADPPCVQALRRI